MGNESTRIGAKIRNLRLRSNISLRQLARDAGVAVSYVSSVEKDAVSPTLTTLRKILLALGSDLATFFADAENNNHPYIFRKCGMKTVNDAEREYTFVLPRRSDIKLEVMDELYHVNVKLPEFETIACDMAGYVVSGAFTVEIGDEPPAEMRSGDAFYVPAGTRVRGYCTAGYDTARLLTVLHTPEY